ncbi:hypothetical protein CALVIDRAFT_538794 [Calocera viscosa TUFC12733]|uniref:F-box domain-containing protein n=1 Tax=Calocera viscosa (strain TUFC12733) TaxID=1330018 RepID=A0A167KI76_CALVF|nr:hypothetical protein CALVIDRAFT_538794 [Calocera viscosa TUFC12733]
MLITMLAAFQPLKLLGAIVRTDSDDPLVHPKLPTIVDLVDTVSRFANISELSLTMNGWVESEEVPSIWEAMRSWARCRNMTRCAVELLVDSSVAIDDLTLDSLCAAWPHLEGLQVYWNSEYLDPGEGPNLHLLARYLERCPKLCHLGLQSVYMSQGSCCEIATRLQPRPLHFVIGVSILEDEDETAEFIARISNPFHVSVRACYDGHEEEVWRDIVERVKTIRRDENASSCEVCADARDSFEGVILEEDVAS